MNKIARHIYGYYLLKSCTKTFNPIDFLRDKNVAVIGAADTIYGQEWGDLIDDLDIVIRINKAPYVLSPETRKFIGSKTNILYHSFFENPESGGGIVDPDLFSRLGIEKLINPNNNKPGIKAHLNFYKRKQQPISTYLLQKDVANIIASQFEESLPTIGFYGLASTLLSETNSLYITGFSFFKTPYLKGYRDNLNSEQKNKDHLIQQGLHDPGKEFQVFKDFIEKSPSKKIILDAYITKLLAGEK